MTPNDIIEAFKGKTFSGADEALAYLSQQIELLLSQEQARGRRLMKILQKVTVSRYPKSLAIAALAEEEATNDKSK